jgi:hypothetical protein
MDPVLKKVTLSLRLPAQMRVALESAAKGRRSLGGEIEARLNASLARNRAVRPRHIKALSEAVAWIALGLEKRTQLSWIEDGYTQEQLAKGLALFLRTYSPGEVAVPPAVTAEAAKNPADPHYVDRLGETVAGGIISALRSTPEPPTVDWKGKKPDMYYPDEWWAPWRIEQDLQPRRQK